MNEHQGLSILLPAYNCDCSAQIARLCQLAEPLARLGWVVEIVVMEDGSRDAAAIEANARACDNSLCRHVVNTENVGRAAVRNRLIDEARCPWLLFQDAGLQTPDDAFLTTYVHYLEKHPATQVLYGGFNVRSSFCSLRYCYERATAGRHSTEARRRHPYAATNFCNMLLRRSVAQRVRLDERFHGYGYEDVMFGRQLRLQGIPMDHIHNPVLDIIDESNEAYLKKTEEAMRTLHQFADELQDDVRLLQYVRQLRRLHLLPLVRLFHRLFGNAVRRQLAGDNPQWRLFNLYKLGYYVLLEEM